MSLKNIRLEVMQYLEKNVDSFVDQFLIPVENIWQPSDMLPNSEKEIQLACKNDCFRFGRLRGIFT